MSIFSLTHKVLFRVSNAPKIVIEYSDLKAGKDLTEVVEKAYGPQGICFFMYRAWNIICEWGT